MQEPQGPKDDTSLNDIRLFCCKDEQVNSESGVALQAVPGDKRFTLHLRSIQTPKHRRAAGTSFEFLEIIDSVGSDRSLTALLLFPFANIGVSRWSELRTKGTTTTPYLPKLVQKFTSCLPLLQKIWDILIDFDSFGLSVSRIINSNEFF